MDYFSSLQVLWNYLVLKQTLSQADCILVFGGHDKSVAIQAAKLYKQGLSNTIIVSGGVVRDGALYGLQEHMSEAEALSIVLQQNGVPSNCIFLEKDATNTRENFLNISHLLKYNNFEFSKFIIVQKPYAERRTYALGLTVWPNKTIIMSSIQYSLSEYLMSGIPENFIIQMMLGEIERIIEYPKRGYMIYQEIPQTVIDAYEYIKTQGFSGRKINS